MPNDNSDNVPISSFTYFRDKPFDFVPQAPPTAILVWQASAFPWDLPYVWEEQQHLGWPSAIVEADDPLTVFLDMATQGRGDYNPLALIPDIDRPMCRNTLNAVLRSPGPYRWDDYFAVWYFIIGLGVDPRDTGWWGRRDFATLLRDAHTLQDLATRYGVHYVGMPAQEKRRTGRPVKLYYDWGYLVTQSGQLSHTQAFNFILGMQGIDLESMTEAERDKQKDRYTAAMKRRKARKV